MFSFEESGTTGKEADGQESGMEEAEAALNSDEELSKEFANGIEAWYAAEDDQPARQDDYSVNLSANFMQLNLSEHGEAQIPALASSRRHTVAARVRELEVTLPHSESETEPAGKPV